MQGSSQALGRPGSLRELEIRAQALCGHRVADVAHALGVVLPVDARRAKGFVGQLAELVLGADPLAGSRPDFPGLGVELKSVPINDQGLPVGSTFCCSINMLEAQSEVWETSRLRQRLARVLWLPVQSARHHALGERRFGLALLWTPSVEQMDRLQADWEDLSGAIGAGRGGSLTAREGRVLQVRPKAANARVRTLSLGPEGLEMALPLGFYLRPSFTANILMGVTADSP